MPKKFSQQLAFVQRTSVWFRYTSVYTEVLPTVGPRYNNPILIDQTLTLTVVSCATYVSFHSKSEFLPRDTKNSEFLDLVDIWDVSCATYVSFRGNGAFSVETVIVRHMKLL